MTRRPFFLFVLIALLPFAAATPAGAAPDGRSGVRQALRALLETGTAGVQAEMHDDSGSWTDRAGTAVVGTSIPVPADGRFRIDGITLTFTSVVVLQLVQEGRVSLDDPVERYLPGLLRQGDRITVRMLLQQTSGLHNYENEVPNRGVEFLRDRFRDYTPAELVAIGTAKPPSFEPGARWEYSSTNFVVAGMLIEKLTGQPYRTEVASRILGPLDLSQTTLPGHSPFVPGPHAHGYLPLDIGGKTIHVDVTEQNPSFWYAAGEIISTTRDLDRFSRALATGELVSPELFAEMTKTVPSDHSEYGLGLLIWRLPCGRVAIGHDGSLPGFRTFMVTTIDGARRVQFSENVLFNDPSGAHWLAEYGVMTTALC